MFKETTNSTTINLVVNNNMPHLIKVFIKIYPHIPIQQAHIQEYTIELMQAAMRLRLSEEKTQAVKREFSTV